MAGVRGVVWILDVGMVPLDWGNRLMRCHILEHAESGMRTLVTVGEN
jgi:FtsP/CotA-like multicopper oxidase with cupredoxin domain